MNEKTVRLPFAFKNKKAFVKRELTTFLNSSSQKQIEFFVTANVVLKDNIQNTYSVFYGQDFFSDHKHVLYGPIILKSAADLRDLPDFEDDGIISETFDKIYREKSGLSVYSVENVVYIFRSLVKN